MTKEETLRVLAILKAAYPASYNGMTKREAEGTVAVWTMQFADIPGNIVLMAVQKLISTNKFPPAISEVKEKIGAIHWEAYEWLYNIAPAAPAGLIPEDVKMQYRRIYEATKPFKMGKMGEPSLPEMLAGRQMLLLEKEKEE